MHTPVIREYPVISPYHGTGTARGSQGTSPGQETNPVITRDFKNFIPFSKNGYEKKTVSPGFPVAHPLYLCEFSFE
jgi:hypothetical protein